jgi:HSP20 family molecular chaperone IbpA
MDREEALCFGFILFFVSVSKAEKENSMKAETKLAPQTEIVPETIKIEEPAGLLERMREAYKSISERAYEFFEKRGKKYGQELEDWFRAEFELFRPTRVEINEFEDHLLVHAEVPGFTAKDIKVSVEPNRIILNGRTEVSTKKEEAKTVYTEFHSNELFRSLELPVAVDPAKVKAVLKDGILEVFLPKAVVKKVPVKVE